MAKWGSVDLKKLKRLLSRLKQFSEVDYDAFCQVCCKELTARLLELVVPQTPVGKYPVESGKKGGTLRRGWTATGEKEAVYNTLFGGRSVSANEYAQNCTVSKRGNTYVVEIINPVEYASYVEYGHRTRGGDGWVPGRYMLTISEEKLRQITPAILERKLLEKLKEVFSV